MLQIRSCQVLFLSFLLFQPYLFSLPIFEFLHATNFSPYCNVPCSLTNSLVVISHHQDIALQYVLRCCPSSFFSLHFASSLFTCLVTVHVWAFFYRASVSSGISHFPFTSSTSSPSPPNVRFLIGNTRTDTLCLLHSPHIPDEEYQSPCPLLIVIPLCVNARA